MNMNSRPKLVSVLRETFQQVLKPWKASKYSTRSVLLFHHTDRKRMHSQPDEERTKTCLLKLPPPLRISLFPEPELSEAKYTFYFLQQGRLDQNYNKILPVAMLH